MDDSRCAGHSDAAAQRGKDARLQCDEMADHFTYVSSHVSASSNEKEYSWSRTPETHPASLGQVHDVETAVTFSVSCLVQTKALALSDAFDALFLCVSHGAPLLSCMDHTPNDEE